MAIGETYVRESSMTSSIFFPTETECLQIYKMTREGAGDRG